MATLKKPSTPFTTANLEAASKGGGTYIHNVSPIKDQKRTENGFTTAYSNGVLDSSLSQATKLVDKFTKAILEEARLLAAAYEEKEDSALKSAILNVNGSPVPLKEWAAKNNLKDLRKAFKKYMKDTENIKAIKGLGSAKNKLNERWGSVSKELGKKIDGNSRLTNKKDREEYARIFANLGQAIQKGADLGGSMQEAGNFAAKHFAKLADRVLQDDVTLNMINEGLAFGKDGYTAKKKEILGQKVTAKTNASIVKQAAINQWIGYLTEDFLSMGAELSFEDGGVHYEVKKSTKSYGMDMIASAKVGSDVKMFDPGSIEIKTGLTAEKYITDRESIGELEKDNHESNKLLAGNKQKLFDSFAYLFGNLTVMYNHGMSSAATKIVSQKHTVQPLFNCFKLMLAVRHFHTLFMGSEYKKDVKDISRAEGHKDLEGFLIVSPKGVKFLSETIDSAIALQNKGMKKGGYSTFNPVEMLSTSITKTVPLAPESKSKWGMKEKSWIEGATKQQLGDASDIGVEELLGYEEPKLKFIRQLRSKKQEISYGKIIGEGTDVMQQMKKIREKLFRYKMYFKFSLKL